MPRRSKFTSLGSGNADSLAGPTYTDGIGVTASLNSTDQGSASPSEGSPKYTVGAGSSLTGGVGVSLAFLLPGASAALPASETPTTEEGGAVDSSSSSDGFDGAGRPGVQLRRSYGGSLGRNRNDR